MSWFHNFLKYFNILKTLVLFSTFYDFIFLNFSSEFHINLSGMCLDTTAMFIPNIAALLSQLYCFSTHFSNVEILQFVHLNVSAIFMKFYNQWDVFEQTLWENMESSVATLNHVQQSIV